RSIISKRTWLSDGIDALPGLGVNSWWEDDKMPHANSNANSLRQALKEALTETLLEQRDLFRDIFAEVLEDFALAEAIREGKNTKYPTRNEVFQALQGKS